ncbi:hypothetical protein AtNW77_Chr3g0190621 [Arabidopsis thaliana]|uniref:P1R3 n=4 Tax=Arabidopsis TaxID=3701 RepID=A0A384L5D0_ARATH|nr:uncharacterized protein AT3G29370 [Arabidopsis thaliana]KAG7627036.1 hypothetical protein ISN45_At03g031500 [Arabidopsis thaliana x Arabidopsis arenosa]AAM64288.1 unknown [Arabidopsis thaliana]AAO63899.1 unknown protein [Arabidopsis thaliana]AEE77575.1 hypothetical protein AT3G29370 [Arabidopsis thaliana]OAP02897.1 P1R3 [Arabidopsis thaliana]|eukprot:NP_566848.1 hypothetical protein AT3G29370 [Arabidopsis thaliana]
MRTLKTQTTRGRRRANVSSRTRVLHTCCGNGSSDGGKTVMEKLLALKSLLPPPVNVGGGETEELFQETAEYIVKLRTQVVVLKKLIEIYDNSSDQKKDVVL